jgi:hypothetical protein
MTHTSTELQSPLTQDEKRREMEQDRKARKQQGPTTFKDFASAFANETRGGRYAKSDAAPLIKPLTSGPWSPQPTPGDEPPLGYDINAVPDLGFPKSVAPTPASPLAAVETATDERGGATEPQRPSSSLSEEK